MSMQIGFTKTRLTDLGCRVRTHDRFKVGVGVIRQITLDTPKRTEEPAPDSTLSEPRWPRRNG